MSLLSAFAVLVALLAGCISGTTVRTNQSSGGGTSPTPTPTATGSASPTATASVSPSASTSPGGAGTETVLDTGQTNIYDLTFDDTYVYYTVKVSNTGGVFAVRKDGTGSPIQLASGGDANTPWGIACDSGTSGNVYYTDYLPNPQGKVWSVPKPVNDVAQGTPVTLATGLSNPTFLRINNVAGGDGLLYTVENVTTDGRVLRFRTDQQNQDRDASTFIQNASPAGYNLRIVSAGGTPVLLYTLMDASLTTGSNGEVRFKTTTAAAGDITTTTLIGTGLLNPTDVIAKDNSVTGGVDVIWTEYDNNAGSVRRADSTDVGVRGTALGQASGSVSLLPPVALRSVPGTSLIVVSRNAQQSNGGGLVLIDRSTDLAQNLLVTGADGQVSGGVNFPFQFREDGIDFYVTEFNFTQGANGLSTQPSRLVKLNDPTVGPKTAGDDSYLNNPFFKK
jgi:hypothetical protein